MKFKGILYWIAATAFSTTNGHAEKQAAPPNVLLIVADDLGIGDVGCYGSEKVATPNIDRLATQGVRALDAHSTAAVCTPSRYGMLTGQYYYGAWHGELLVKPGQLTIASVLHGHGYATGYFGKWHLGWGRNTDRKDRADIDWNHKLPAGVLECGFDYFFGTPFTHNEPPFVFVRNRRVVGLDPSDPLVVVPQKEAKAMGLPNWGWGSSTGAAKAHAARPDARIDLIVTQETRDWIRAHCKQPFFAQLSLAAPHVPVDPARAFRGKSGIGLYGDFVEEMDWCVGQVLKTLDECGVADNTLVIFASDNGAVVAREALKHGHHSNLDWLGQKTDAWEGGVREPFIARWPGKVPVGATTSAMVSLIDLCKTVWAVAGVAAPEGSAKDSLNELPVLLHPASGSVRHEFMQLGLSGYALRSGDWVYLPYQGSGGLTTNPDVKWLLHLGDLGETNSDCDAAGWVKADAPGEQLYNLKTDPTESRNVIKEHPEKAQKMAEELKKLKRMIQVRANGKPGY